MRKNILSTIVAVVILLIVSLLLSFKFPIAQSFRIVFGLAFVTFLPGFVWSFIFFQPNTLNPLGRIVISIICSISLISLTIFFTNKLGVKVSKFPILFEIILITLIGAVVFTVKHYLQKNSLKIEKNDAGI